MGGLIHSFICFRVLFLGDARHPTSSGRPADVWLASTCFYSCVVFVVTGKVSLLTTTWTRWNYFFVALTVVVWFFSIYLYCNHMFTFSPSMWGVSNMLFGQQAYWIINLATLGLCLNLDIAIEYFQTKYFRSRVGDARSLLREIN